MCWAVTGEHIILESVWAWAHGDQARRKEKLRGYSNVMWGGIQLLWRMFLKSAPLSHFSAALLVVLISLLLHSSLSLHSPCCTCPPYRVPCIFGKLFNSLVRLVLVPVLVAAIVCLFKVTSAKSDVLCFFCLLWPEQLSGHFAGQVSIVLKALCRLTFAFDWNLWISLLVAVCEARVWCICCKQWAISLAPCYCRRLPHFYDSRCVCERAVELPPDTFAIE